MLDYERMRVEWEQRALRRCGGGDSAGRVQAERCVGNTAYIGPHVL